jgi:uncharacterized membrane protein
VLMLTMLPAAATEYPGWVLLGTVLVLAGPALVCVGVLGWRGRLPRNRFAGVRTPAALRSDAAFRAANRVAAPPVVAAGVACLTGGTVCFAATGAALAVVGGVTGVGALLLLLAGGVLGNRAAEAVPPGSPWTGCVAPGCVAQGLTGA